MRPPDCTTKALRQFIEAPGGEPARSLFGAFATAQADEEKRDARDRRQMTLPGLDRYGTTKQAELFMPGDRREGGRLLVPTYTRCTVIDARCLARFEKAGQWLLKEDGDGYRLRSGRGSVYVMPGQLKFDGGRGNVKRA